MASHIIPSRIQFIIQFINDHKLPSKPEMIEFLKNKDFNISTRTLERDIERIRSDYGLEIVYNKAENGYYIDNDKSVKVESFFKFLEIVSIADIFSESLLNSNKILEYVSFDDSKGFKGIQYLKEILLAISQHKKLYFTHENFTANTIKEYVITPFLLKEYENRWYVIGVPEGYNEIRTFGVDRLTKLCIGKTSKLNKKSYYRQIEKFDNIIGLDFNDKEPTYIRLQVNGLHIKYMKSLPLHHSQIIHSENENGQCFVDFLLAPNYELRTTIKNILSDSLKKYL